MLVKTRRNTRLTVAAVAAPLYNDYWCCLLGLAHKSFCELASRSCIITPRKALCVFGWIVHVHVWMWGNAIEANDLYVWPHTQKQQTHTDPHTGEHKHKDRQTDRRRATETERSSDDLCIGYANNWSA